MRAMKQRTDPDGQARRQSQPMFNRVFRGEPLAVRRALAELRQCFSEELSPDTLGRLELVLAEVLNNVAEHGPGGHSDAGAGEDAGVASVDSGGARASVATESATGNAGKCRAADPADPGYADDAVWTGDADAQGDAFDPSDTDDACRADAFGGVGDVTGLDKTGRGNGGGAGVAEAGARAEPPPRIHLCVVRHENGLACAVTDDGVSVPDFCLLPRNLPNRGVAPEALPEGGFGWYLIQDLTQALCYFREDQRNFLAFSIPFADLDSAA